MNYSAQGFAFLSPISATPEELVLLVHRNGRNIQADYAALTANA